MCIPGQFLRQDPDAAEVQVLTKACIWGNNLYNAGKGKIMEQVRMESARPPSFPRPSQRFPVKCVVLFLALGHPYEAWCACSR